MTPNLLARPGVRGTFSQPGPSRPAAAVRLARTLGLAGKHMWRASIVSTCRRELNSHEKTKPQDASHTHRFAAENLHVLPASFHQNQDETPLCPIDVRVCEQVRGIQSGLRAAAAPAEAHRRSVARRLQPRQAEIRLRRGAPAFLPHSQDNASSPAVVRAWPNQSLKRRPTTASHRAGETLHVYHRPRRPGVLPQRSA